MFNNISSFTDVLDDVDEIANSQPFSLSSTSDSNPRTQINNETPMVQVLETRPKIRPVKQTGQRGDFRSIEEIDEKYRSVFAYPYFNLVQSRVIDEALYSDKSMVVCAPTGSGKTVVFEMAIVQLLMELEDKQCGEDFKIIYMAPVKALCTERLTEWYSKFTKLGLLCIEVTGDTDVDFNQLKPYRIIITTPEKWDMLTRRWRDHRSLVEMIKLFLIDEVHILNDATRGPVLEAVVSRMKTIESSAQSAHRIEQLQKQYQENPGSDQLGIPAKSSPPRIRFVAVSATINNPEDVAAWLGNNDKPAVYFKFGDECRPVKLKRVVEGYPCPEGTSIFKFDIILNYKLWPIIQKYHNGKPTLIFCNTRKGVTLTAETLSKQMTINFTPEQKAKLTALASTIKNKKLQSLVLNGLGCHHAGLLYEERLNIERAFRNRDLPILITTTTLAMGVNLPAHLVIVKNTQQYVNGAYQEYSISTVLQMVGRAGRPQFDTEATAVIMTRLNDKPRYQALVGGNEPLQSYLHKRLAENLNSEVALGTVSDVAQCVQWVRSTFLCVRAARDPKWYLGLPTNAPSHMIMKKIEEMCVQAMNGLATAGLITMDEVSCIESTEAGRLMSIYYLDLETMKHIMKIEGTETLERLLWIICECHELSDIYLRVDERRCLNALNRNNAAATIRFPMKGKISSRQMKLNCMIQAVLGCLPIPDPSLNQEATKVMRIAERICKCLVAYVTRSQLLSTQPQVYSAVLNSLILAKCIAAHMWENSHFVSKQLRGIGPAFSTLLASAGKVNFMLLEESHPRDLERIMNKGPPAGNVLRKQISLLPKYQVTMTPIDAQKVSIQLTLLNQAFLAENLDELTAGENHKSYVVVGDSENHLLLLTNFKDKDLISVYDGNIAYEITRRHSFEHKILVHCISTSFVGIDAQSEYLFKDLEPLYSHGEASFTYPTQDATAKKTPKRQTSITDTFKERKRKSNNDITQSKEKKKRDNTVIEKFKNLKQSFATASKELKDDLHKSMEMSNEILHEIYQTDQRISSPVANDCSSKNIDDNNTTNYIEVNRGLRHDIEYPEMIIEDIDDDNLIVDEQTDRIVNEIITEISKSCNQDIPNLDISFSSKVNDSIEEASRYHRTFNKPKITSEETITPLPNKNLKQYQKIKSQSSKLLLDARKRKFTKSNYDFMESFEKNDDLTEHNVNPNDCGFTDAIKVQIAKIWQNPQEILPDRAIIKLINYNETEKSDSVKENSRSVDPVDASLAPHSQSKLMETEVAELPGVVLNEELKGPVNKYRNNNDIKYQDNIIEIEDPDGQTSEILDLTKIDDFNEKSCNLETSDNNCCSEIKSVENLRYADTIKERMTVNINKQVRQVLGNDTKYQDNIIEVEDSDGQTSDILDLTKIDDFNKKSCNLETSDNNCCSKIRSVENLRNDDTIKETLTININKQVGEVLENDTKYQENIIEVEDSDGQTFEILDLTKIDEFNEKRCELETGDNIYCRKIKSVEKFRSADAIKDTPTVNVKKQVREVLENGPKEWKYQQCAAKCAEAETEDISNLKESSICTIVHKGDIKMINSNFNKTRVCDTIANLAKIDIFDRKIEEKSNIGIKKGSVLPIPTICEPHTYKTANHLVGNASIQSKNVQIDMLYKSLTPKLGHLECLDMVNVVDMKLDMSDTKNEHSKPGKRNLCTEENKNLHSIDITLQCLSGVARNPNSSKNLIVHKNNDNKLAIYSKENSYNNGLPEPKNSQRRTFVPPFRSNQKVHDDLRIQETTNTQKDKYVNKYSFTATKFDVCTKNTPEHQVQIVRKFKVDLDVTEIVSKGKTEIFNDNTNKDEHDIRATHYKSDVLVPLLSNYNVQQPPEKLSEGETKAYDSNVNKVNQNVRKTNVLESNYFDVQKPLSVNYNTQRLTEKTSKGETKINDKAHVDKYDQNIRDTKILKSNYINFPKTIPLNYNISGLDTQTITRNNNKMLQRDKKTDINDRISIKCTSGHKKPNNKDIDFKANSYNGCNVENNTINEKNDEMMVQMKDYKNSDSSHSEQLANDSYETKNTDTENSIPKVASILEKYSKRLVRKGDYHLINNIDTKSFSMTVTKPKEMQDKSKRPCKISDIHHLDIPLPNTLVVEVSRHPMPTNDDVLTRIKSIPTTAVKPKDFVFTQSTTDRNPRVATFHEDTPEYSSPVEEFLEEPADLPVDEIDESMLNPKILLQYHSKKPEEIIPPPLEFCDEGLYSPKHVKFYLNDPATQESYFESNPSESEFDITSKIAHETSIFDDDKSHKNLLTPTKEIETWTFSTDENFDASSSYQPNLLKSCTVMRNNSPRPQPRHSNLRSDNFNSTIQDKLNNFKFIPKNKYKKCKYY